jgi:hypothetical protein
VVGWKVFPAFLTIIASPSDIFPYTDDGQTKKMSD